MQHLGGLALIDKLVNKVEKQEQQHKKLASNKLVGYCKECRTEIYEWNKIKNSDEYECSKCHYPNSLADMK